MSLERFRRPLATATEDQTVERAAQTMRDEAVGCLIVVRRGRPAGIVTDRDLVVRVIAEGIDPTTAQLGAFVTYDPVTVSIDEGIETAAQRMHRHGIRRLPIVDDQGEAVGIVTSDDLLQLLGGELAGISGSISTAPTPTRAVEGPGMKRIVVGLDGSTRAPGVLAAAVVLAQARGAVLMLVRAVGLPPDLPQDFWKTSDQPLQAVLARHAREYLEQMCKSVPTGLLGGCEVVVGSPWQTVCEAARRLRADLVVIGSHGYGAMDRLLGTTAAKIVNHAPCSVMVVRDTIGG